MSVTVNIHTTHRQFTGGKELITVEGKTIGECLHDLVARFADMKNVLFDQKGRLSNLIEIYLNLESAYPDELLRPTADGDEIHITVMLAGG